MIWPGMSSEETSIDRSFATASATASTLRRAPEETPADFRPESAADITSPSCHIELDSILC
jgi:hypothetical protein